MLWFPSQWRIRPYGSNYPRAPHRRVIVALQDDYLPFMLPYQIWHTILTQLSLRDLAVARLVCSGFKDIVFRDLKYRIEKGLKSNSGYFILERRAHQTADVANFLRSDSDSRLRTKQKFKQIGTHSEKLILPPAT